MAATTMLSTDIVLLRRALRCNIVSENNRLCSFIICYQCERAEAYVLIDIILYLSDTKIWHSNTTCMSIRYCALFNCRTRSSLIAFCCASSERSSWTFETLCFMPSSNCSWSSVTFSSISNCHFCASSFNYGGVSKERFLVFTGCLKLFLWSICQSIYANLNKIHCKYLVSEVK